MQFLVINLCVLVISLQCCVELVEIVCCYDLLIVENDMLNVLIEDCFILLVVLVFEWVLYINGFIKLNLFGLWVVWLVLLFWLVVVIVNRYLVINWMVIFVMVELLSYWIGDGMVDWLILW